MAESQRGSEEGIAGERAPYLFQKDGAADESLRV
jgi:hypothetical protein